MKCVKCGREDVNAVYCNGKGGWDAPCRKAGGKFVADHEEHLHIHCHNCQYSWSEPCLDAEEEE